jgi:hypothetical protein
VGLTGLQFVLALVLVFAVLFVALYLINKNLIDTTTGPAFYADVVQGIVILGGAFFGIPLTWRAGKSSGETEGKAKGEEGKDQALKDQRQQIGATGTALIQQARTGHNTLHNAIQQNFATTPGTSDFRLTREDIGNQVIEIEMEPLNRTSDALARLDQFMNDLQAG